MTTKQLIISNHIKLDLQHNKILRDKKILSLHYRKFYNIIKNLSRKSGVILEIGSNNSDIKKIIKKCITSNYYLNKKIDKKLIYIN